MGKTLPPELPTVDGPSPRVWGKRTCATAPDHPHACGENAQSSANFRTIPTRVGKTYRSGMTRAGTIRQITDHPHACGENGNGRHRCAKTSGPIPTRVGKTLPPRILADHPHACGENAMVRPSSMADHPHACGENTGFDYSSGTLTSFSPSQSNTEWRVAPQNRYFEILARFERCGSGCQPRLPWQRSPLPELFTYGGIYRTNKNTGTRFKQPARQLSPQRFRYSFENYHYHSSSPRRSSALWPGIFASRPGGCREGSVGIVLSALYAAQDRIPESRRNGVILVQKVRLRDVGCRCAEHSENIWHNAFQQATFEEHITADLSHASLDLGFAFLDCVNAAGTVISVLYRSAMSYTKTASSRCEQTQCGRKSR